MESTLYMDLMQNARVCKKTENSNDLHVDGDTSTLSVVCFHSKSHWILFGFVDMIILTSHFIWS